MVKKKESLLLMVLILILLLSGCGNKEDIIEKSQPTVKSADTEAEKQGEKEENITPAEEVLLEERTIKKSEIQFPLMLENGKIEIENLFPFEGFNPDAGNEIGSEIASISVRNLSNQYLENISIVFEVDEESKITFRVTDLPAGASALAFSTENRTLGKNMVCSNVTYEVVFASEEVQIPEQIFVEKTETEVSVTNISEQDIGKVTIYCRCLFDEEYFGGIAYQYELQELVAGETKLVNAEEFILGKIDVVRIEIE